jgi:hypothetical protein
MALNPSFIPTWTDLQQQMLESIGSKEERMQRAFNDMKKLTQGGKTPSELLNKFRILWAEVGETLEPKKIYDYVAALNESVRNALNASGYAPFKTLADAEARINQIQRTLPKSTKQSSTTEGRRKRFSSPPHALTQSSGGKRGKGGHSSTKRGGGTPRKDTRPTEQPLANRTNKSAVVYYFYNKLGYYKNECPTNPEAKPLVAAKGNSRGGGLKKSRGSKS